jgi:ubiquinone/menaquinone biosynthesis C-methylase UbiE
MGDSLDLSGLERFDRVDETGESEKFRRFLDHLEQRPEFVARRRRSYELLAFAAGTTVVDVGCGTGTAVRELATAGANAIGVDLSADLLQVARERAPELDFREADLLALPFEDGSIDGYRAERVYQHVAEPARALREAARVLASGGRIVLVDPDWEAFLVDGTDRRVTRAIANAFSDSVVNGWIGRQCFRLLREAGFADVRIEPETTISDEWEYLGPLLEQLMANAVGSGAISEQEGRRWLEDLAQRAARGTLFSSITTYIATATNP